LQLDTQIQKMILLKYLQYLYWRK